MTRPGPEESDDSTTQRGADAIARGRRAWQAAAILTAGALTALGVAAASAGASPPGGSYQQINMVSDQPGVAPLTDLTWSTPGACRPRPEPMRRRVHRCGCPTTARTRQPCIAGATRDDGDEGPPRSQRHRCHVGSPDRSGIQHRLDVALSCTTQPATPPRRPSSSPRRTVASTAGIQTSEPPSRETINR